MHPLEIGLHALGSGLSIRDYAARCGSVERILLYQVHAAEVSEHVFAWHALIVRPNASGYEIISGHHRAIAATRTGLETVPCWVREMSDEDAYMALALHNAQSELSALEVGAEYQCLCGSIWLG